ncbi:hypothetical protein GCM10010388_21780 [Streptomyces mauvecolor]
MGAEVEGEFLGVYLAVAYQRRLGGDGGGEGSHGRASKAMFIGAVLGDAPETGESAERRSTARHRRRTRHSQMHISRRINRTSTSTCTCVRE